MLYDGRGGCILKLSARFIMSRAVLFSGHLISTSSPFSNFVVHIEKIIAGAQNFIYDLYDCLSMFYSERYSGFVMKPIVMWIFQTRIL